MIEESISKDKKLKLLKSGDFTCQLIHGSWYAQDGNFHAYNVETVGVGKLDEDAVLDYIRKLKETKASVDEALSDAEAFLKLLQK